jgi:hypothetical protein
VDTNGGIDSQQIINRKKMWSLITSTESQNDLLNIDGNSRQSYPQSPLGLVKTMNVKSLGKSQPFQPLPFIDR